jgi:hypothetical protein
MDSIVAARLFGGELFEPRVKYTPVAGSRKNLADRTMSV